MTYLEGQFAVALAACWVFVGYLFWSTRMDRTDNRDLRAENVALRDQVDRLLSQISLSQGIPGYRRPLHAPPDRPEDLLPGSGYFDKKSRW